MFQHCGAQEECTAVHTSGNEIGNFRLLQTRWLDLNLPAILSAEVTHEGLLKSRTKDFTNIVVFPSTDT
jgi:hypothetical protein